MTLNDGNTPSYHMQLFPRLTIDPYYQRRKDSPGSIHFIFSDVTCTDRVKQGRTQYGADGAKATLPEIKKKLLFTHSNTDHFMFCSLYKKSVSQSFYNNRYY